MSKIITKEENKENKNNNCSFYRHLINKPFTKYTMNEEDYEKREDTIRKFRQSLNIERKDKRNPEENKETASESNQFEIDLDNCENYLRIFRIRQEYEKEIDLSDTEIKVKNEINEFNSDEDEI